MAFDPGPQSLSKVLSELIAIRGYARQGALTELQTAWQEVVGPDFAGKTRAVAIRRGTLHVHVQHAVLVAELTAYHRERVVQGLSEKHPRLKIKDVKFKLDSGVGGKS
jgi:hypothetical protein